MPLSQGNSPLRFQEFETRSNHEENKNQHSVARRQKSTSSTLTRVGDNRLEKMARQMAPFPPRPDAPFAGVDSGAPFFSSEKFHPWNLRKEEFFLYSGKLRVEWTNLDMQGGW